MKKMMLFCAVLCVAATAWAKPAGVWKGYSSVRINTLIMNTLFTPQWTNVDPQWIAFNGKDFHKVSAVVYLHGPGKFIEPKKGFYAQIEKFVREGGTFIFIADGVAFSGIRKMSADLAKLTGAKKWAKFAGKAEFADKRWKDCGNDPQVFKHMLAAADADGKDRAALTGLASSAKMLIGNKSGALLVENTYGKGKFIFSNIRLTESLTAYNQPYHNHANAALEQYWPFAKQFYRLLVEAGVDTKKSKREKWEPIPIGPKVREPVYRPLKKKKLVTNRKYTKLKGEPLLLVVDGKANAIIQGGKPSERGAINKLNSIIKAITGTTLPNNNTSRLKASGNQWSLGKEKYAVKITYQPGKTIKVRAEGNLISITAPSITMGFYALMREAFGYRMLWPGKEGEAFMGPTKTLKIAPFEYTDAPGITQRYIRDSMNTFLHRTVKAAEKGEFSMATKRSGFDPRVIAKARAPYNRKQWWSANFLGGGVSTVGGANFYGYYKRFGKTHPEYMALQFNGTRKMRTEHVRICKSNPAVVKQAVQDIRARLKKKPDARYVRFSPSDGSYDTFCMCPNCRKYDPVDGVRGTSRVYPGAVRPVFRYTGMTDRVLRFTTECAKELAKTHPNVNVAYLAYAGYLRPPQYFNEMPKNLYVSFVGIGYLSNRNHKTHRKYWDYWAGHAKEMCWRPNFLGGGNGLPFTYPHRMGADLKHFAATGMIAGDFDTLPHHWATQALNYYTLAALLWDPARSVDDIIDEFCTKGFGAGAKDMKAYYALLEEMTDLYARLDGEDVTLLENLTEGKTLGAQQKFLVVFLPRIAALRKHIAAARAKVAPDSREAQRIEFVSFGLEFTIERTALWNKVYKTPAKERGKLRPEITAMVERWHEYQVKHPFAVGIPGLAGGDFYGFWRSCGWSTKEIR